eukprot:GHVS01006001.1.p1 GENE.GHVS01006001.1~~GHVS01006001.1.p1  ORF type:complete len:473 (-),score=102.77 GHVS01006001.1:518-1936(-)
MPRGASPVLFDRLISPPTSPIRATPVSASPVSASPSSASGSFGDVGGGGWGGRANKRYTGTLWIVLLGLAAACLYLLTQANLNNSGLSKTFETFLRSNSKQQKALSEQLTQLSNTNDTTAGGGESVDSLPNEQIATIVETAISQYLQKHPQQLNNNNIVDSSATTIAPPSSSSNSSSSPPPFPAVVGSSPDMSMHVVCHRPHWKRLSHVAESILSQTYSFKELIVVLTITEEEDMVNGGEALDVDALRALFLSPSSSRRVIGDVKVFVRGGKISQGNNRRFASTKSTGNLLTFFDCDDYMHSQRTEVLHEVFKNHPDLHIALHRFDSFSNKDFTNPESDYGKEKFAAANQFTAEEIQQVHPAWSYDQVRSQLPTHDKEWNQEDGSSEPNRDGVWVWWFPAEMTLPWPQTDRGNASTDIHNGWVTARREVFDNVDYPDLFLGEDSLFNWRAIRKGYNFTALYMKLGVYLNYAE